MKYSDNHHKFSSEAMAAMINTSCLVDFIRRAPASVSLQGSEIADFTANIGCPANQLLPLMLQSADLQEYFAPLLARLCHFPAQVPELVNTGTMAGVFCRGRPPI